MSAPAPMLRPLAFLAFALPALVHAQQPGLAARLFRSGERAYLAKSYKEALDTWNQLLQSEPKSEFAPQALLRLAKHQIEVERRPGEAMAHLDRLRTEYITSPEAAEGLLLRGMLLADRARHPGDLKDAMAEFHRVLDLFPDAPACGEARLRLGLAWRDQGQWGRALEQFVDAFRLHPSAPSAPRAMFEAAEAMDQTGDLPGCLRMLQRLRAAAPECAEAKEAAWRMAVRVKHRLKKPPLVSAGPWPEGRTQWLKTPTLLATAPDGSLLIFQNGLDQAFRLRGKELEPVGPAGPGARAMVVLSSGGLGLLSKHGLLREGAPAPRALGGLSAISGAAVDRWGRLWVADARSPGLLLFPEEGEPRALDTGPADAMASLGPGGVVIASDNARELRFLDAEGQARIKVPYGQGLPAPFRSVTALASDGAGQVAALVDGGGFGEGVVIFGPDGAVLRQAAFKALGLGGRITSLVLNREGHVILCDRRNDLLIRLD